MPTAPQIRSPAPMVNHLLDRFSSFKPALPTCFPISVNSKFIFLLLRPKNFEVIPDSSLSHTPHHSCQQILLSAKCIKTPTTFRHPFGSLLPLLDYSNVFLTGLPGSSRALTQPDSLVPMHIWSNSFKKNEPEIIIYSSALNPPMASKPLLQSSLPYSFPCSPMAVLFH